MKYTRPKGRGILLKNGKDTKQEAEREAY